MPFTVLNPVPGITSISPTTVTAGTTNLVLTVNGSGFLSGANGTSVLFNGNFVSGTVTVTSPTQLTIQVPPSSISTPGTIFVDTFNPQPGGGPDLNPAPPTLTVTASTASFTLSGAAVTVTAGSSGMSAITVTPSGGFTGTVNVTCGTTVPGVTCTPNPLVINIVSASPVASNLGIAVAAPSSTTSAFVLPPERKLYWSGLAPTVGGGRGWWGLSAVTGLAAILLLLLPGRKRYRAVFALGLVCVLSFTMGCSSGYGGGGGGGGTSATTTKISVTSTKVSSGTSVAFTVTVTSTGSRVPTGSVQLYDGTSLLGTAAALTNGSATINISNLSVGTHGINAHYLADAYSNASQSGTLNIAITGSTTVAITGTSGSLTANGTVNLAIN